MDKIKAFIMTNKFIVTMTSAVSLSVFLIFTVIAVAISGTPSSPSTDLPTKGDTTTATTMGNVAENTSDESVSFPHYTGETDSCGSEDESTEVETEPPVDPNTLPYMIMVNRAANCVTVYEKDANGKFTVPVKAMVVSCGKNVGDTPTGTYQTINEYNWRKMVDDTYGQYAYRIVGSILFHSVPYYTQAKNDLEWEEYNKLGSAASLGCIRMSVRDAKWLMDNCPIGTKVTIYDDAANPGPLGKPEAIKIPADSPYKGWDPTDPDPANPWKQFSATITYPSSQEITVKEGASINNILTEFSAKDTCGNDISDKIKLEGTFDLTKAGTYKDITVSVTDAIGSHAKISITIIVEAKETTTSPSQSTSENNTTDKNTTTENQTTSDKNETTTTPSQSESTTTEQETTTEEDTTTGEETTSQSESTTPQPEETSSEQAN